MRSGEIWTTYKVIDAAGGRDWCYRRLLENSNILRLFQLGEI